MRTQERLAAAMDDFLERSGLQPAAEEETPVTARVLIVDDDPVPTWFGTGSEDYLNQAWGMQDNAFLRNGSSIHERNTDGYQTSYVHHIENPVSFEKEIKVTIEHGHGNHLCNEMSSVAYWYAAKPTRVAKPPSVAKRMPVLRDNQGNWLYDAKIKPQRHTLRSMRK